MRALRPAQMARDRVDLPWWTTTAIAIASGLALGIAGRAGAQGQLTPTTAGLAGVGVGALAVVGLPSFSIALVARLVLMVSAAVLVRFGVFGDALAGAGQVLVGWVVAAVAVLVLTDRASAGGRSLEGSDAPPGASGPGSAARTVVVVAAVVVLASAVAAPLLLPHVGEPTAPGSGPSLDPFAGGPAPLRASDSLDMASRPDLTDEVVLTIEADRPSFWRGQTFDTWDGRRWSRSAPDLTLLDEPGVVRPAVGDLGVRGDVELVQRVRIEAAFAEDQQSFPCVAFGPFCFVEVTTQLTLTQTVIEFDFLLFD